MLTFDALILTGEEDVGPTLWQSEYSVPTSKKAQCFAITKIIWLRKAVCACIKQPLKLSNTEEALRGPTSFFNVSRYRMGRKSL